MSNVLKRPAPVDVDAAVDAIARRDGIRIMPDGLVAASRLGLTNAVPARASYATDGPSKTIKVDGRTIYLRHAGPSVMQWSGKAIGPVFQALRWLGPHAGKDPQIAMTLQKRLPGRVRRDLARHAWDLPDWAEPLARGLVGEQTAAL